MRVICNSVEEFLENLTVEGESVFQNVLRVSINTNSVDKDGMRFDVFFSATACIRTIDDAEYLLVFCKKCGIDYEDGSGERPGSEAAGKMMGSIRGFAGQRGLRILPGVLDY